MNRGLWASPREALMTMDAVAGLMSTIAGTVVLVSEKIFP